MMKPDSMKVEVEGLCYSYTARGTRRRGASSGRRAGSRAVDGISLEVSPGEHLVLLGPSGSGKSTFLALLAGFLRPAAGTIAFDGRLVSGAGSGVSPRARHVGMVFQDLALWPHLSVDAHLEFALRARRVSRRERCRRKQEILDVVGLSKLAGKLPTMLSGGEAQRLALARALVGPPRILLLDEPLGGLDRALRGRMLDLIHEVQATYGITTIHVTHDYEEVAAVATRAAVLENGTFTQLGTLEEIYRSPASASVARLGGSVTLVEGTYGGERCVEVPWGVFPARFDAPAGSVVTVALRPEDVEVRARAAGDFAVTECRFHGGRWEVEVARRGLQLLAQCRDALEPGEKVEVTLREPVWGFAETLSTAQSKFE